MIWEAEYLLELQCKWSFCAYEFQTLRLLSPYFSDLMRNYTNN